MRKYLRSLILAFLAVTGGLIALLMFPKDSPVSAQGGFTEAIVSAPFVASVVEITETPKMTAHGLNVWLQLFSGSEPNGTASVELEVPRGAWGGGTKCASNAKCSVLPEDNNYKLVIYQVPNEWFSNQTVGPSASYVQELHVTIPDIGYGMSENFGVRLG